MASPDDGEPPRRRHRASDNGRPARLLHLGCLVDQTTHFAVRAYAAQKGVTIRRLILTSLRQEGVPIPAGEIEKGHR